MKTSCLAGNELVPRMTKNTASDSYAKVLDLAKKISSMQYNLWFGLISFKTQILTTNKLASYI